MSIDKIIITTPYKSKGGVFSFVDNILPFFRSNTVKFKRGSLDQKGKIYSLLHSVITPFRFVNVLQKNKFSPVIINSSLNLSCIIRDGLLIYLAKLSGRKVLLVLHGFKTCALKYKKILKIGYFKADNITVLSSSFSKLLKDTGYKKGVHVILNPVNQNLLKIEPIKLKNSINGILFLSRIEHDKGIITALKAYQLIKKKYPNISFTIAGTGRALSDAKEFVKIHNVTDVLFAGFVTGDLKQKLLRENEVFLFPTFHKEGLPICILEAMASGQVIITRPVGGIIDLYKNCEFGSLVASNDPEDYADAIDMIIQDKEKYKKLSGQNIIFSRKYFHPQNIANIIEGFILNN